MTTAVTGGAELALKTKYKPTPLSNLSIKSTEAQTLRVLRENPTAGLGNFTAKPVNTVSLGKYAMRKTKGMATGQMIDKMKGVYKTGDGEFQNYGGRTGCMDFKKCPSHGFPT